MSNDLLMDRPLVTVFGDHDALDAALNDELDRRGRAIHSVTTPLGWLSSVTHAVLRVNSATGVEALRDLASRDAPPTQVVAVCETGVDEALFEQVAELCRRCGEHHAITLIWHAPLELKVDDVYDPCGPAGVSNPLELAISIADEVGYQEARPLAPVFATQNFEPRAV